MRTTEAWSDGIAGGLPADGDVRGQRSWMFGVGVGVAPASDGTDARRRSLTIFVGFLFGGRRRVYALGTRPPCAVESSGV
jgi:hypothetical protein